MAIYYTRESDVITCCRICSGGLSDATVAVKGRDEFIERVMASLAREPSDRRSVRVVGAGGVGKTAVAEEVVRRFSRSFDRFRKTVMLRLETGQDKTKGLSPEQAQRAFSGSFLRRLRDVILGIFRTCQRVAKTSGKPL
jgi:ATP-dependent Clp protease ATP-binding subunit ClpA